MGEDDYEFINNKAADTTATSLAWVASSGGAEVDHAIEGGQTCDGTPIRIARAPTCEGELTPGKLVEGYEYAHLSYGREEYQFEEYEVLTNPGCVDTEWVAACGRDVPAGAVEGGTCIEGYPIYIARGTHEESGDVIPGKVVPRCDLFFIAYGGVELHYSEYEVLCVKSVKPQSQDSC